MCVPLPLALPSQTRTRLTLSLSRKQIEGLIDDLDFRTEITRASLEARAASLVPHLSSAIQSALETASLSLSDIESVILVGGSSRVPLVQAAVAEAVGADKIAKNVNADEAGVLGAALYGASSVPGFRTKDIRVVDVTPFAVDVAYEAEKGSTGACSLPARLVDPHSERYADELCASCLRYADGEPRIITTHLFPAHTKLPSRKTLTLRRTTDFSLDLSYPPSSLPAAPAGHLSTVRLTGITSACANLTSDQLVNATVQVPLELDANGLVKVGKAVLILREDDAESAKGGDKNGVADKLKGLFSRFAGKNGTESGSTAGAGPGASEGDADEAAEGAEDKEPMSDEDKAELDRLLAEAALPPAKVTLGTEIVQPQEGGKSMAKEDLVDAKKRCVPFSLARRSISLSTSSPS